MGLCKSREAASSPQAVREAAAVPAGLDGRSRRTPADDARLVIICWSRSEGRVRQGATRGLLIRRNDPLAHSVSHKGSLVC